MLKKALFLIVIFSGCTTQQLLDVTASVIQEAIKSNKEQKAEERENILNPENRSDPKRKVGDKWIDSNGKRWVQRDGFKMEVSELKLQQYTGWWIYGEGQHIFKDEQTLGEWELTFPNENMQELVELYLAVCEMEYFPMECNMIGHLNNDTLKVTDFEITYIQGCGN